MNNRSRWEQCNLTILLNSLILVLMPGSFRRVIPEIITLESGSLDVMFVARSIMLSAKILGWSFLMLFVYGRERESPGCTCCLCVGGRVRGIGQTFSLCMGEGESPGCTCCLCVGGRVRGIGQTFPLCMVERERPGWTCCLCVGGIVRGIRSDLSLVYGGGRESWLDLLLVCGKESEGHRSDLLLVNGREKGLVGPAACVWEGE